MIKKTIAMMLAALMIAALAACGQTASTGGGTDSAAVSVTGASGDASSGDDGADGLSVYERYPDAHVLVLGDEGATLDGTAVAEYDYVWNADPSQAHDEVKDCPAEYYTGTAPSGSEAVYIAHDIYYYPELDESSFRKLSYDGEQEWVYYYTAEGYEDYIFATLPVLRGASSVPTEMMHSAEEAYENPVVHITQAGTYILEGSWHGQIWIDLGDEDDTFADESAKVTLVLNGVSVECSVAPALVFRSVYEADNGWEGRTEYSSSVDISDAGAAIVIADGTENDLTGANVFRMLKAKLKSEDDASEVPVQKKARKTDGAVYSYVSMTIDGDQKGTGVLNIRSTTYEGLDTELHLAVNGGNINIWSQDDGINCNEDYVSVIAFNGGTTHIYAGLGAEGDGIDSNGYIVVNDGTLIACASPVSDNGLDSESGTEINGGTVVALGSNMGGGSYTVYVDGELQYGSSAGGSFPGTDRGDGNFGRPDGSGAQPGGENGTWGFPGQNGGRPPFPGSQSGEGAPDGGSV